LGSDDLIDDAWFGILSTTATRHDERQEQSAQQDNF
jgi:hypothetical protein